MSTRWIVLSLAASTMPNSTTLLSNSRKLQRAYPSGGLEQARAINRASFSPSKIRRREGAEGALRAQHRREPVLHPLLAHPVDHGNAGLQSLDDPAVAPPFAVFRNVGLQQDARL